MKYFFLLFSLFPMLLSAQNSRFYVRSGAAGANDGSSWADAFSQLTAALQVAQSGDTVWVAEGTYLPDDDRDSSFRPKSGVRLYGGFAGIESRLDQRDWVAHPCILSGDVGIPNDSADNSYTIMYLDNPDSLTVVDGFLFRYGMATYGDVDVPANHPRRSGGALYIMGADGEAYATIRHCRFEHNHARNLGGAVYINGSDEGSVAPQFLDCIFTENSAGRDGGAVYRNGSSWVERIPDFGGCIFQNNRAGRFGGGLYFQDAERTDTLQLDHCDFLGNEAGNSGGGVRFLLGRFTGSLVTLTGGNYAYNVSPTTAAIQVLAFSPVKFILMDYLHVHDNGYPIGTASDNTIEVNTGSSSSGANLIISNTEFSDNRAGSVVTGGIESFTTLTRCTFRDNDVVELITLEGDRRLLIENCTFKEKNVARRIIRRSGYKLIVQNCLFQNEIPVDSSGVYSHTFTLFRTKIEIINCTIVDKKIFLNVNHLNNDSIDIQIKNCILSGTQGFLAAGLNPGVLTVSLANSCLYNTAFDCTDLPPGACGPGILTGVDPQFVQPDSGDYRIQPCSPLIGAGDNACVTIDNTIDLDGNPRIIGQQVDIGAYEHTGPRLATPPVITPSCTAGSSGAVDFQPENGCVPYTYAWSAASGGTGTLPTQLAPGDYTFTIYDAHGAYFTVGVTVPDSSNIQLTLVSQPVVCGTALGGTATATLLNAAPPYTYAWAGGSMDSVRTDLAAGFYPVTVTDAQGCTATGVVEVGRTGGLMLDIQVELISCPGAADGGFVVLPTDGQAPFVWQWENGPASPAYAPLGPGAYRGMLTDVYNCSISWILPLDDPQAIAFDTVLTQASGFSVADGSAMVTNVTGGHPSFSVLWSNGMTGYSIHNLLPGMYTVTVTDANGCQQVKAFTIPYTSAVQAAVKNPLRLFPNPVHDALWLELPGYVGLYKITLTNALGQVVLQSQSDQVRSLLPVGNQSAGVYTLQVVTAQGAHYQAKAVIQH